MFRRPDAQRGGRRLPSSRFAKTNNAKILNNKFIFFSFLRFLTTYLAVSENETALVAFSLSALSAACAG